MTTMKALVYNSSGFGSMLWAPDFPVPQHGRHEVLVRVISSSLNPVDFRMVDSGFLSVRGKPVGCDIAGRVCAVGSAVTTLKVGDFVFGWGHGLAEYAISDPTRLALVPWGLNASDFGIYPTVATTAYQLLNKHWLGKPGYQVRSILVIGASGGVGSSVVQFARAFGGPELSIFTVSSASHLEYCREIGANECFDYRDKSFEMEKILPAGSLDLIVDTVSGTPEGSNYVEAAKHLLRDSGKYVTLNTLSRLEYVGSWFTNRTGIEFRRKHHEYFIVTRDGSHSDLDEAATLIANNQYRLEIAHEVHGLEESQLREAFALLRQRHMRGKIKVTVLPGIHRAESL